MSGPSPSALCPSPSISSPPPDEPILAGTLASWAASDFGETRPHLHLDTASTGHPRQRIPAAWLRMLRHALAAAASPHLLLFEDDLAFHPRLRAALLRCEPLTTGRIRTFASLYNPGLPRTHLVPAGAGPRAFAAQPALFTSAQALLLARPFAEHAVAQWESVAGMQSGRLARLSARDFPAEPIWVHRPSLIQHTATASSWGAPLHRAADFDPGWEQPPIAQTSISKQEG